MLPFTRGPVALLQKVQILPTELDLTIDQGLKVPILTTERDHKVWPKEVFIPKFHQIM